VRFLAADFTSRSSLVVAAVSNVQKLPVQYRLQQFRPVPDVATALFGPINSVVDKDLTAIDSDCCCPLSLSSFIIVNPATTQKL
jgi:hypothetical protein